MQILVLSNRLHQDNIGNINAEDLTIEIKKDFALKKLIQYAFVVLDASMYENNQQKIIEMDSTIHEYLKQGGKVMLYFRALHDTSHGGQSAESAGSHNIGNKFLNYLRFLSKKPQNPDQRLKKLPPAFQDFLKNYGTSDVYFTQPARDPIEIDIISHVENFKDAIKSFSTGCFGGRLIFLGCTCPEEASNIKEFIIAISKSGKAYFNDISPDTNPSWLNDFAFHNEKPLKDELSSLEKKMTELTQQLIPLREPKRLFTYRGTQFASELAKWIQSYLGLPTKIEERYKEDFVIADPTTNETIILCEAKSIGSNVKLPHLNQAAGLRARYDKSDAFPVLLIVDTFNDAKSIQEKLKAIDEQTCQQANAPTIKILITRAVDIMNLYELITNGVLTPAQLIGLFTQNTGCLKVEEMKYEILKGTTVAEPPSK